MATIRISKGKQMSMPDIGNVGIDDKATEQQYLLLNDIDTNHDISYSRDINNKHLKKIPISTTPPNEENQESMITSNMPPF